MLRLIGDQKNMFSSAISKLKERIDITLTVFKINVTCHHENWPDQPTAGKQSRALVFYEKNQ